MLLSRMFLDLRAGAPHRTKNHPIETPQLSLPPCPMRVYLVQTLPPFAHEAFHAVTSPHSKLFLHFRGVGKNCQLPTETIRRNWGDRFFA